jgi:hypothetical protein
MPIILYRHNWEEEKKRRREEEKKGMPFGPPS